MSAEEGDTVNTAPQEQPEATEPAEPKTDYNIESAEDLDVAQEELKKLLDNHDFDFKLNLRPKKMRGSTSQLEGDGLQFGEVNIPGTFKVKGFDNTGKPIDHGEDNVVVEVLDPNGNPVEANVKDNGDGTYDVDYTPLVPGEHEIRVKVNDEAVNEEPAKVLVSDEVADATYCTAEGPGLESAEVRKPAQFTITARNKIGNQLTHGGVLFDVAVKGPTSSAEVRVEDKNDGTYEVEYTAKEIGDHEISVQIGEAPIKDTPKTITIALNSEEADPNQTYAEGPGVEGGFDTHTPGEFTVYAVNPAGERISVEGTQLNVTVTDEDANEVACELEDQKDGTFKGKYKAEKPGKFAVSINVVNPDIPANMEPIKDSPFNVEVSAGIDASKCKVCGPGVEGGDFIDDCNDAEFQIEARNVLDEKISEGGAKFTAKVTDPNKEEVPCEVTDKGDGTYECKYAPEFPGEYTINVFLDEDEVVGKSPYTVLVGEGVDTKGTKPDCYQFTCVAKNKRGPVLNGLCKFVAKIVYDPKGEAKEVPQERIEVKHLKGPKYRVVWSPEESGEHEIHCLLGGREIVGSPWTQTV